MASVVETAIRDTIAKGVIRIAEYNRAHATPSDEPHPYLTGIHTPMSEELTLGALRVTGTIPPELNGRYLRNGPNPVQMPNTARYHWFAGDGMVHAVRIEGGRADGYRNRWVRSTGVSKKLGEAPKPGPRLTEIPVNTNVIGHAGKFFALVEAGGTPVELDSELGTVAHNPFEGTLKRAFSAHPHRDPDSGELHAICYHAPDLTHVHHVVVGADGRVRREEPIAVEHGPSIHDCALTKRFVLVFDLPMTFSMSAMVAGFQFPYRWNPDHKARVGLLPREGAGDSIIWCDVDPCYVFHPANAYDLEDGRVMVDVCVHDRNGHRDYRGPDADVSTFERWTIDPVTQVVTRRTVDATAQEFPRFDERRTGQPYRYVYAVRLAEAADAANMTSATAILKHDLVAGTRESHEFGAERFPGEFVFIPRGAGEDEGWLMGLVVDAAEDTTELVILDARDVGGPPQAIIHLPHRVPPGFHGNWVEESVSG